MYKYHMAHTNVMAIPPASHKKVPIKVVKSIEERTYHYVSPSFHELVRVLVCFVFLSVSSRRIALIKTKKTMHASPLLSNAMQPERKSAAAMDLSKAFNLAPVLALTLIVSLWRMIDPTIRECSLWRDRYL